MSIWQFCGLVVLVVILASVVQGCGSFFRDPTCDVTYYTSGEYTYDGSRYDPNGLTCAIKDKANLHQWFRFEYHGSVVYCWANDILPSKASASYDLTPAAFMRLAPLKVGRLHNVYVDLAP